MGNDAIEQLKARVFGRQKNLAEIYNTSGRQSLFDYTSGWKCPESSPETRVLAATAGELLGQSYPRELAKDVAAQLSGRPLVSTIDHHGILNHPFFINSNLIFSLKKDLKYLICLPTSGISLNNSSWPACLLLSAKNGRLKRFSFFGDKAKTQSVFAAPALGPENLQKILKRIAADAEILPGQKTAWEQLLGEIFKNTGIYKFKNFSGQAGLISSLLWSKIFPSAPKVIYLPVEDLAARLITAEIIPNSGHILHKLFFSQKGLALVQKYFSGSPGAFSSGHKGSFLFWGIGKKGRRVALGYNGFNLSADDVTTGLSGRNLYPTSLVCFLVLLYYDTSCLGGFNQVNWLTDIKQKFLALLLELDDIAAVDRVKKIPTQNFAEANLAFLPQVGGLIKATGIDLYLSGRDYYPLYRNLAKSLTLAQSIESLLPEIYRVITPAKNREAELLKLDDLSIAAQNGIIQKVKTVFNQAGLA